MDVDVDNSTVEEFKKLNEQDAEFARKCDELANEIKAGSTSILQLVEHLKTLLIDTVPNNRQLGMVILYRVIELLPDDLLANNQLNFICAFYSDRLNDHHQVIPAVLHGILTLLRFKNVPEGVVKQFLGSLFQNVPCQQQQQIDRYNIYKILEISLDTKYSELLEMGFDFIYGVISAMDGERDPRNLLHLFQWLPKFLKSFKLGHLTEEMFEVLACYFPVDFKAPSQDPDSISRESLAETLCVCLCSVSEFAELCLPLALEKLSSSLRIAKLDSLNILAEGCKTFPASFYVQHATDIWAQIVREVNSKDSELQLLALSVFEKVLHKLSQTEGEIFEQILDENLNSLKSNLVPHLKSFDSSSRVLLCVAKASNRSASYTIKNFFSLLINVYNMTTTITHQAAVLKVLANLIRVCSDASPEDVAIICTLSLEAVVQNNDELCCTGYEALSHIISLIPVDLRMVLYDKFRFCLVTRLSEAKRSSFLSCFKAMAEAYSKEVETKVLNCTDVTAQNLQSYLDTLVAIVGVRDLLEVVLNIFLNYCTKNKEEATTATNSLKRLLNVHGNNSKILNFLLNKQIVSLLVDYSVQHLSDVGAECLLRNVSSICKSVIRPQTPTTQFEIVNNKLGELVILYRNNCNFAPVIILIDGLIISLHREIELEYEILDDVLEISKSEQSYIQNTAILLLANILNKAPERKLDNYLQKVTDSLETQNLAKLTSYVTKALVMRGHPQAPAWTQKLLDLLTTNEEAVRGFQIVMEEKCESLSVESFCNIKLLYRQKFFTEISNKLIEKCKENNPNYLVAFGYLLRETPIQVLALQFDKILNLVVLSLNECNDVDVLYTILNMLSILIQNKESRFEELFQEFLPRFLNLAKLHASMKVRIKALQCLRYCAEGYHPYKLLPHKQDVIGGLMQCLDDKKRLVRKEAVEARLRWFMLDSPI